jgi:Uri superfamily endonuclease
LPEAGVVTIRIFNLLGQEITTLVNEYTPRGNYKITFDSRQLELPSGMYLYMYSCGKYSQGRKMLLLK